MQCSKILWKCFGILETKKGVQDLQLVLNEKKGPWRK